jgi:Rrf2 family nitric oxide-sensitive transcriptional repressor
MFSSTAEYALRAIVHLAMHGSRACPAAQIAGTTQIPPGYVSKVLQDLGRAGLVQSQRGPNGGFTLTRDAAKITVLEVVNAVDPIKRIVRCPLDIPSHGTKLCRLHQRLDDAIGSVEKVLSESSIADMVEPTKAGTRCLFPSGKGASAPVRLSVKATRGGV